MKKLAITIVAMLSLSGCAALNTVIGGAAKVNDEALKSAEFTVCQGASIGSIRRRFNTPELAELWRKMCEEGQGFKPAGDVENEEN